MIKNQSLLSYKNNTYSQNGEDGIIEYLTRGLSIERGTFCEFGAWDGIHLSNCRALVEKKWSGVFIEGEAERYQDLVKNYQKNKKIATVNSWVDTAKNSLDNLLKANSIRSLDFLSIDIDGLDYEIMKSLKIRPRIICIEVNAGHGGHKRKKINTRIAKNNVGQPLSIFVELAESMGYGLVCYTGNAFFVRKSDIKQSGLATMSSEAAYADFLQHLTDQEKEWLFLVNLGLETPYYKYLSDELMPRNFQMSPISFTRSIIKATKNRLIIRFRNSK